MKDTERWQARIARTKEALWAVSAARSKLSGFPAEDLLVEKAYLKLNDYLLTCYEEEARAIKREEG